MKEIGKLKTKCSAEIEKSIVSIGFECLDRDLFTPEKSYDLLAQSGVKYARVQTGWAKTEKQKGIYDFVWLDSIVDNLKSRGITPWFNVGYGNPVYMDDVPPTNPTGVGFVPLLYGDEVMEAWLNFVKATVEHFSDRVTEYEIWNEPDCDEFWHPGEPNASQYAEFVKKTSDAIKSVFPKAETGACIAKEHGSFLVEFFATLPKNTIDFFNYHGYEMAFETNKETELSILFKILKKYGHENVRIGDGECGHASFYPENHGSHPDKQSNEDNQAIWLLRRYITEASLGVKRISFFQAVDLGEKSYVTVKKCQKVIAKHGLMTCFDYRPKRSHQAMSHISVLLSGDIKAQKLDFFGKTYGEHRKESKLRYCTFIKNGEPMYCYYHAEFIQDTRNIPLSGKQFSAHIYTIDDNFGLPENPIVIDMFSGKIIEINENDIKRYFGRVIIDNLPIADYPMVICSKNAVEIDFD